MKIDDTEIYLMDSDEIIDETFDASAAEELIHVEISQLFNVNLSRRLIKKIKIKNHSVQGIAFTKIMTNKKYML